ncbi:MAG: pseudouridine synthase [Parvularculaceae bacterium]
MSDDTPESGFAGERIAKFLARAGIASRREAERLIEQGIVTVDGRTLTSPAFNVTPEMDVRVDGTRVGRKEATRLWRYHKPAGLVTTHRDPQGRRTVFDAVADRLPRVVSVGRLDLATEGLLLLTNDGGLARTLELPATGWVRRYRVRAFGSVREADLAKLADGVEIDGVAYRPIRASIDPRPDDRSVENVWLTVAIAEGKNREVRKVMSHLGLKVNRLIRTAFGPFQLGKLARGALEEVPAKQLKEQLGPKTSAELGL